MMRQLSLLLTITLIILCHKTLAQQHIVRLKGDRIPIICYADTTDIHTHRQAPETFRQLKSSGARVKSSTIEVTYFGFTPSAQLAFEYAVSIWESLITSPVKIRVAAVWTGLDEGTLGAAGPSFWVSNFDGAPKYNVYYPGPLAEKLAGQELNDPSEYDIVAQFNSGANWYLQTTGTPAENQYDLVTVVLHELGHGLGFTSTFTEVNGNGLFGEFTQGIPFAFDLAIQNGSQQNLYQTFNSPSSQMSSQLRSGNIFFDSFVNGNPVKLYAPVIFNDGSSISHLDALTFPQGNLNSLMRPFINSREVNHDPGPITQNIFKDIGWVTTYINHAHLPDREDVSSPIEIKAIVRSDGTPGYSFDPADVKLAYTTQAGLKPIEVAMTPTGNVDEFSVILPAPGTPTTYFYFIEVKDSYERTLTSPGAVYTPDAPLGQKGPDDVLYSFFAGADTNPPEVTHTAKPFISYLDDEPIIDFEVRESSGVSSVSIQYRYNNGTTEMLTPTLTDASADLFDGTTIFHYRQTIAFTPGQLQDGDEIQYTITARDNSSNQNESINPETDSYAVTVVGLAPAKTYYVNDFNSPSDDFIGTDFSITQPSGFTNPAIHTVHPYPEAGNNNNLSLTYQLRVPIQISGESPTMSFDEIVLVEPGENGVPFPNQDFYDYVVVEGSLDGGQTWQAVADGYDSRDYEPWLTRYNSTNANGDASLFRKRTINLSNKYANGELVVFRFRLYSDPFSAGWGWCIDNLRIQTDNVPPEILHHHLDYVQEGTTLISLPVTILDELALAEVTFEYNVNEGETETSVLQLDGTNVLTEFQLAGDFNIGDVVNYRFTALDSAGNSHTLPATGFFTCPIISFDETVALYANNFDTPDNDFVGNFFTRQTPSGFQSGSLHTPHPYLAGFGLNRKSDFTYTLKKKIIISSPSYLQFNEVCLVEDHPTSASFGDEAFHDFVIVEASKDDGLTWIALADGYDAGDKTEWRTAYTSGQSGTSALFRKRRINMEASGDLHEGDIVLIRFRLFSNESLTGWGWAIDDLHIQDAITSAEVMDVFSDVVVYPNPASGNTIAVDFQSRHTGEVTIRLLNAQGLTLSNTALHVTSGRKVIHQQDIQHYPDGLYVVNLIIDDVSVTKRFILQR